MLARMQHQPLLRLWFGAFLVSVFTIEKHMRLIVELQNVKDGMYLQDKKVENAPIPFGG